MPSTSTRIQSVIHPISSRPARISIPIIKSTDWRTEGHHAGDMQNITVDAQGKAKTKIVNKDVNWGNDSHSIFSNGGTALVIHAKADDMKTDPAGNAGDRIACGVITKQ